MRCIITKQIKWHMAHRVPHHKSKCRSMHGHTYLLTAEVIGEVDEHAGTSDEGMVMDFGDIKQAMVERVYQPLDHACMLWYEDPLYQPLRADPHTRLVDVMFIPTAENIARWCFEQLEDSIFIPERRWLLSTTVNETPTSTAKYIRRSDPWTA